MAINRDVFYAGVKRRFGPRALDAQRRQTRAAREGFDAIVDAFERLYPTESPKLLAYILATAYHETGATMIPVRENFKASDEEAVRSLSHKDYAKRGPNGKAYYGRGYVQLTWDYNYKSMGERLGRGTALVDEPDLVMEPLLAAEIICVGMLEGKFNRTGQGLKEYITEANADFRNARRTVNLLDKADDIAGYARKFDAALLEAAAAAPVVESAPAPIPVPVPGPSPAPPVSTAPAPPPRASPAPSPSPAPPPAKEEELKPLPQSRTIWGALIALIAGGLSLLANVFGQIGAFLHTLRLDLKARMNGFDPLWIVAGVFVLAIVLIILARIDDRNKRRR